MKENIIRVQLPFVSQDQETLKKELQTEQIFKKIKLNKEAEEVQIEASNMPIILVKNPCKQKLVKVTKLKHKMTGKIIQKLEVIGDIDQSYDFDGLQDFQFQRPFCDDIFYKSIQNEVSGYHQFKNQLNNDQIDPKIFIYQMAPSQFMRSYNRYPDKFNFFKQDEQTLTKKKIVMLQQSIYFDSKQEILQTENPPESLKQTQIYQLIVSLFQTRPIWLRNSLMICIKEKIENFTFTNIKKVLSYVSYNFKNGPWKHTYIKFGYDPRKDTSSVRYQIIDILVKNKREIQFDTTKRSKKIDYLKTYDPTYTELPDFFRHIYQLCDLQDENIIKTLKNIQNSVDNFSPQLHKKYGWLNQYQYRQIYKCMKDKSRLS